MDVAVQLHIPHIFDPDLRLALDSLGTVTGAAEKACALLETVDVLGIRAQEFLLLVESFDKVMGRGRGGLVDRLLELRYESVEDCRGRGIAEEGSVEEIAALENDIRVLFLHERVQAIRGAKVLSKLSI